MKSEGSKGYFSQTAYEKDAGRSIQSDIAEASRKVMEMCGEAVALANAKSHDKALEILVEAEEMARSLNPSHPNLLAYVLREKAITLSTGGQPSEALNVIEEAEELCELAKDYSQLYQMLRSKSAFYGNCGEQRASMESLDAADHVLDRWVEHARSEDDPSDLSEALLMSGLKRGGVDHDRKQEMLAEALQIARKHGITDLKNMIESTLNIESAEGAIHSIRFSVAYGANVTEIQPALQELCKSVEENRARYSAGERDRLEALLLRGPRVK